MSRMTWMTWYMNDLIWYDMIWMRFNCSYINVCVLRPAGCSGRVDHDSPVHGWPSRTQIPHGHQRRQREDSCHDQDLRDAWQENLQERTAGSAGRRRGTGDKERVKEKITNTLG